MIEELSQGYSLKNLNKNNDELFKEYLALRKIFCRKSMFYK